MALKNFWWLLIWPFLFGAVSYFFIPQQDEIVLGRRVKRWNWMPAIILAAPFVIWAAGRTNSFGDTGMYRQTFRNVPVGFDQMAEYIAGRNKGKGFAIFEYLFKTLVSQSDIAFFFLVALIQIFCLVRIYRKYSQNYWLSFFLFIASTDYLSWVFNGMRQFLAAAIIFTCIPLLLKKRYVLMCLVVLLASQVHSTALVFLPFVFVVNGRAWNLRTILFIIGIAASVYFLEEVTHFITNAIEDTSYSGDISIFLNDDGTNLFRVLFYSIPAIMSWVFRKSIAAENDSFINMCVNLSIVAAGIYVFSYFTSGILVGRLPIYFSLTNYILIPWLIAHVFEPVSAAIVNVGFVGVYSFFFYYQCGVTWRIL